MWYSFLSILIIVFCLYLPQGCTCIIKQKISHPLQGKNYKIRGKFFQLLQDKKNGKNH